MRGRGNGWPKLSEAVPEDLLLESERTSCGTTSNLTRFDRWLEAGDLIAPALFGYIEGEVGTLNQVLMRRSVIWIP